MNYQLPPYQQLFQFKCVSPSETLHYPWSLVIYNNLLNFLPCFIIIIGSKYAWLKTTVQASSTVLQILHNLILTIRTYICTYFEGSTRSFYSINIPCNEELTLGEATRITEGKSSLLEDSNGLFTARGKVSSVNRHYKNVPVLIDNTLDESTFFFKTYVVIVTKIAEL